MKRLLFLALLLVATSALAEIRAIDITVFGMD
jgi:hypothetical protein